MKSIVKKNLHKICTWKGKTKKGEHFSLWAGSLGTVRLYKEQRRIFEETVDLIMTGSNITKNFLRQEIVRLLQDAITKIFHEREKSKQSFDKIIDKHADELIKDIFVTSKKPHKDWQFLIPIQNLELKLSSLQIGEVQFIKLSQRRLIQWRDVYEKLTLEWKGFTDEQKKEILERDFEYFEPFFENAIGKTCAFLTVPSNNLNRARESALFKTRHALNVLHLYWLPEHEHMKDFFGIYGEHLNHQYSEKGMIYARVSDTRVSFSPYSTGYLGRFSIDMEFFKLMNEWGLRKINKILRNRTPTEVEAKILRAIWWFAEAIESIIPDVDDEKVALAQIGPYKHRQVNSLEFFHTADRFMKFIVALESLLIAGSERMGKSAKLAKRGAILYSTTKAGRAKTEKLLESYYGLRSQIIHGGPSAVMKAEMNDLLQITQNIILSAVKKWNFQQLRSEADLIAWFKRRY